jgi:hypothetical protein
VVARRLVAHYTLHRLPALMLAAADDLRVAVAVHVVDANPLSTEALRLRYICSYDDLTALCDAHGGYGTVW